MKFDNKKNMTQMTLLIVFFVVSTILFSIISNLYKPKDIIIIFIALIFMVIMQFVFHYLTRNNLPIAYNIAIIGFPKSGKTTLITSIFSTIFMDKFLCNKIILRSKSTIERINYDLEKLAIGKSLGPTKDQDLFAYRFDVKGKSIFSNNYKVEIGDFPGEDSEKLSNFQNISWLHETPYFKWVMEADGFIFVIDLANVLNDHIGYSYRAKITNSIRAAWQHIVEYHVESKKKLSNKPLILLFSKADLLIRKMEYVTNYQADYITSKSDDEFYNLGFGDYLPAPIHTEKAKIDLAMRAVMIEYKEIIGYLSNQSINFHIIAASHLAIDKNGRVGIPDLIERILP